MGKCKLIVDRIGNYSKLYSYPTKFAFVSGTSIQDVNQLLNYSKFLTVQKHSAKNATGTKRWFCSEIKLHWLYCSMIQPRSPRYNSWQDLHLLWFYNIRLPLQRPLHYYIITNFYTFWLQAFFSPVKDFWNPFSFDRFLWFVSPWYHYPGCSTYHKQQGMVK